MGSVLFHFWTLAGFRSWPKHSRIWTAFTKPSRLLACVLRRRAGPMHGFTKLCGVLAINTPEMAWIDSTRFAKQHRKPQNISRAYETYEISVLTSSKQKSPKTSRTYETYGSKFAATLAIWRSMQMSCSGACIALPPLTHLMPHRPKTSRAYETYETSFLMSSKYEQDSRSLRNTRFTILLARLLSCACWHISCLGSHGGVKQWFHRLRRACSLLEDVKTEVS